MGSVYRGHEQLSDKEVLKIYSKRHLPGKCFSKISFVFYRLYFKCLGVCIRLDQWAHFHLALAPNIVQLRAVVEIVVIVHGLAVLGWDNVGTRDPCQSCAHQVSELVTGSDNTASSLVMIFAGFDVEIKRMVNREMIIHAQRVHSELKILPAYNFPISPYGEMNCFLMTKTTREMHTVQKNI